MIGKEQIEHIKTTIDLKALAEAKGIVLKKNGKGYVGLCPFHNDTNPSLSVNPSTNLWHCFGCGAGGDAIRFVELFDKVDFSEAVKRLDDGTIPVIKPSEKNSQNKPSQSLTVREKKLLSRVTSYYQHTFEKDPTGWNYLKDQRGINDLQSCIDFGAGYVNGTLLDILPDDDDIIASLKKIGILNAKGKEVFYNCVTFPLIDVNGQVASLYGRNIDKDCSIDHLYLAGPRTGLVNIKAVKHSQTLFLTESVIDALSLYDQGFKNVMPIYGTNGLTQDHLSFFNGKIKTVYIVFDADEAGQKAAASVKKQLKEKQISAHVIDLPDKDVNIFFKRHTPEQFEDLIKVVNPASLQRSENVSKREQTLFKETEHGFIVGFEKRQYHIKGIQRSPTQLKVTIKAGADVLSNKPFELTTIDLYSSRSRLWFAKLCTDLFGADEALIKEDIARLLTLVEDFTPSDKKSKQPQASAEQIEQATAFLKNSNLIEELLADLLTLGVIGETTNKIVCYLAATSRKLSKPLSVLIQSRSSAGKSTLQNAILSLMPEEDYEKYTRVTDQSLFYKQEDSLVHKILAIEEDVGMGGAAYSIRNIQSSGVITVATTGKDPATGKMKTEDYTVKGPVAVMVTTTAPEVEAETASRFVFLAVDESPQMTAKIHAKQRECRTLEGLIAKKKSEKIIEKHKTAQRMLKSVFVVNNFTPYLTYPNMSLVTRRDHEKYLGLIDAVTFLHQYQREIKTMDIDGETISYIEVTLEDIDVANGIADAVLGQSLDELSRPSRTLLIGIFNMVKDIAGKKDIAICEVYFTRRMIREHMGWSDWQIKAHIKQLEELEYLYVRVGSRGKEYAYALNYKGQGQSNDRFYLNLTPVAKIKKQLKQSGSTPAKGKKDKGEK